MKKVSILMACYNSSKFLERSISSVLSQSYKNWELICVDDGSTDNTFDLLTEYSLSDQRIKVFKKNNSGHAAPNFNYALNHVSGDFIFLLGHDDQLSNDILDKMIGRQLETNADIVIPDCCFYYPDDISKNWTMAGIANNFGETNDLINRNILLLNREAVELSLQWKIHAFCLYSAKIVKNIKFCEIGMNGDEYSARKFLFSANKIAFSDGQYIYYQTDNSITKKITTKRFNTLMPLYFLEKFLIKNKFKSNYIKLVNRTRFSLHNQLIELYQGNKSNFSIEDKNLINNYLNEHLLVLTKYYSLTDKFYRKEKTSKGKVFVFFNILKFKYKNFKQPD